MPATGGAVVAANHFSEVDPAMLGIHSRRTLYYMAKIELLLVARSPASCCAGRARSRFAGARATATRSASPAGRSARGTSSGSSRRARGSSSATPGRCTRARRWSRSRRTCRRAGGIDTFGWSLQNRRTCCVVWGEPIRLDLPRTGKGYKEGAADRRGSRSSGSGGRRRRRWRTGSRSRSPDGLRRERPIRPRDMIAYPELPTWPERGLGRGPARPRLPVAPKSSQEPDAT